MRDMIRFGIVTLLAGASHTVNAQSDTPAFLLIVRESLRPESLEAYDRNELALAAACAELSCPHPYLALTTLGEPTEVWWLNAFSSIEQKDGLGDAYARNAPLMNVLASLGERKEAFRTSLTTSVATYARVPGDDGAFRITGARFVVVDTSTKSPESPGALYETDDGAWLVFRTAQSPNVARELAARVGPGAKILSNHPRWSFPDRAWVDADPEFWRSAPAARERRDEAAGR